EEEDDIFYEVDGNQIYTMEEESCISPLDTFLGIEKEEDESCSLSNSPVGFVENCGSWIDSSSSSMVSLSLSETNSNVHTMLISREDASFGIVDSSKVHAIMDKFTDHGLRSLVVARQQVPEKSNESAGDLCEFFGVTSRLREE
ncbi:hypothetical protein SUGI_0392580, partial [Cryptomeria japonica]